MKIRSGFVSNSSSSSFIIIGTQLTKKLETSLIDKLKLSAKEIDEQGISEVLATHTELDVLYTEDSREGCYTVGKVLADQEDYMSPGELSLEEFSKKVDFVKQILGDDVPVKLIYGTRPS